MRRGQRAYQDFLRTEFWIELSKHKVASVGHCERCSSKSRLQSHHRIYRGDWFDTRLEDLEVLCRDCHRKHHGLLPADEEMFRWEVEAAFDARVSELRDELIGRSPEDRRRLTADEWASVLALAFEWRDVVGHGADSGIAILVRWDAENRMAMNGTRNPMDGRFYSDPDGLVAKFWAWSYTKARRMLLDAGKPIA